MSRAERDLELERCHSAHRHLSAARYQFVDEPQIPTKTASPFVPSRLLRLRHEWTHKTQWFGAHPRLQQTLSRRTIAVLLFALLRGTTIHHKVGAAVLIHATTEECNEQLSSPISSVLYVKG